MRRGMSVGQVLLIAGFGFMLFFLGVFIKPAPVAPTPPKEKAVGNIITMECTSIAGTTMIFSLLKFDNDFQPPVYKAVDKNGVVVIIGESNYGEWKCKE